MSNIAYQTANKARKLAVSIDNRTSNVDNTADIDKPISSAAKQYVDGSVKAAIASEMSYKGGYDADTNTPRLATVQLTGTVDPDGTTTLTGIDTLFTSELEVGDQIQVEDTIVTVDNITDDTTLTTDVALDDVDSTTVTRLPINIAVGDTYTVTNEGNVYGSQVKTGDMLIAETLTPLGITGWTIVNRAISEMAAQIKLDAITGTNASDVQSALVELYGPQDYGTLA